MELTGFDLSPGQLQISVHELQFANELQECLSVVERPAHIRQVPAAILAPPICSVYLHCSTQLREAGQCTFQEEV